MWVSGRQVITRVVVTACDKTKTSLFLVTWPLRSLDNQVTEDRASSFAPWFQIHQFISEKLQGTTQGVNVPRRNSDVI